jgi:hypothetical protein
MALRHYFYFEYVNEQVTNGKNGWHKKWRSITTTASTHASSSTEKHANIYHPKSSNSDWYTQAHFAVNRTINITNILFCLQ